MRFHIVFLFSLLAVSTAYSAESREGTEYQSWCSHLADAEKLTGVERDNYVHNCMKNLAAADRAPDKNKTPTDSEE
jgi:hypothetical protein